MLHAFRTDEPVRQLLDLSRLAAEYDDFQAILMVKMRVQSGNDDGVRLVLEIGELFRQQTSVMVVNERDGADDESIRGNNDRPDKPVANQVAKRFRAVIVALICDERIEPLQKI